MNNLYKNLLPLLVIVSSIFLVNFAYADEATQPAGAVGSKLLQNLQDKQKAKTYIGTITDKTETSIQLRNLESKIQLISINQETNFISIGKVDREIDFEEVGIGDFIAALGYINEDEVLDSSRVLVTSEFEKTKRKTFFGEVIVKDRTQIKVADKLIAEEILVDISRNTEVTNQSDGRFDFADIEEGMQVIVTGEDLSTAVSARTISVVLELEKEVE